MGLKNQVTATWESALWGDNDEVGPLLTQVDFWVRSWANMMSLTLSASSLGVKIHPLNF